MRGKTGRGSGTNVLAEAITAHDWMMGLVDESKRRPSDIWAELAT